MRRLFSPVLVLLVLGVVIHGCRLADPPKTTPSEALAGPPIGAAAPEIDGPDLDGQRLRLSTQRGKVAVVSFWANW